MVYVTGDCHARFHKFTKDSFPEQENMTRDDFVIVCGDFGLWNNSKEEKWWLKWLSEKPFTTLFVDGNHENFDRLYSDEFEIVNFHGGMAHKIRDNVYHLMRGYIFDLCGKSFLAFGGASSHDIRDGIVDRDSYASDKEFNAAIREMYENGMQFRINHVSWWKQEMPSAEEMEFCVENLKNRGNNVDFVITHCCPQSVASFFSAGRYKKDKLTEFFDWLSYTVNFDQWYFGHYHEDDRLFGKYNLMYNNIVRVV